MMFDCLHTIGLNELESSIPIFRNLHFSGKVSRENAFKAFNSIPHAQGHLDSISTWQSPGWTGLMTRASNLNDMQLSLVLWHEIEGCYSKSGHFSPIFSASVRLSLRPFVSSFPGRTSARQSVCLATRLFFETALPRARSYCCCSLVSSRFSLLRNALQKLKQIFSQDLDVTQKCTCP